MRAHIYTQNSTTLWYNIVLTNLCIHPVIYLNERKDERMNKKKKKKKLVGRMSEGKMLNTEISQNSLGYQ